LSFRDRTIRVLGIGSILVIAQAVPVFAEKVTLACSLGAGYHVNYLTIDTNAKTVIDDHGTGYKGPYPAQIAEYTVVWEEKAPSGEMYHAEYDRKRASYCGWGTNGCAGDRVFCVRDTAPRPF
jgi:hypothetical protein